MFRRTSATGDDMVAAAQRRLAALARQHDGGLLGPATPAKAGLSGGDRRSADAVESERIDPADAAAPARAAAADPLPAPAAVAAPAPRHLRPARGQLGRWDISAPHLTLVALAVVALVVTVAWWSLRSVPRADSVQLSSHGVSTAPVFSTGAPATPPTGQPGLPGSPSSPAGVVPNMPATTGAASRLVVDVAGKVRRPGIVELPAGSRVVDALQAAGGANPGVSLTSLNLARLLVDGEQIVVGIDVPLVGAAPTGAGIGGASAPPATVAPVNLNTATAEQLDTLPGVGPVTAQAILAFRANNGPFTSVDDLLEVSGIGDAILTLRPVVCQV